MLEKSFWDRLKGFDELYVPAYCEDSDLAFRVRARGKKVYYQPRCEVIHLEGKSHGTKLDSGLKSYQVVNNKKFLKKWNSLLIKEQGKCSSDLFRSRERSLNKKTMLIIDHYLPHYDQDAGSRTMWSYIKFFVNNGFSVKFLGDNWLETEPYQMELQQLGVEVLVGNWARLNWNNWLKENGIYLDYILVSRAHIGVKHLSKLKRKTNAKILFYGHDLLSRTLYNKFIDTGDNNALIESKKWKKLEKTIIDHVDVAYYPSFIEVECLKKEHPTQNIRVLPPYVFDASKRNKISQNRLGCNKILFVGGFRHSPNVEAIVWFVKEIWPNILHCFPDLTLTVVGSYPPDEVLALASNNITVTGFINDKALEECYCSHDLVIAPLLSGGGIKGKIIEALWYGLPVLTTPIGAEGIPEAGKYIKIVQPSDFFSSLKELIEEPKLLKVFSNNASQLIKQYYSEEALYSVLSKDINFV